jgi:hypothetical protein
MWIAVGDGWQIECGELLLALEPAGQADRPWRLVAWRTERTLFSRPMPSPTAEEAQQDAIAAVLAFSRELQTEVDALTLLTRGRA